MKLRFGQGLVLVWLSSIPLFADTDESVDFGRDIRPVLSNFCFRCHGADEASRAGGFRLDQRESAVTRGVINQATPEQSHLLERIDSTDPEVQMPPPDSGRTLTADQKALLRRWVLSGAEYTDHWAFRRIEHPPATDPDIRSAKNRIDEWIQQRLQNAGLSSSPEADRATLIRRATQDVIGLLPTPDETDEFLADSSPDAWGKVVNRLLASPHFGERWGRHWLDQARYADSNGYTIDGPRIMWPWRDWVIQALNTDMPFDQFTIEQLAGDLLPQATLSQQVATAFHRNTMINEEGGVKPDQFRHEALIDRVNTTGSVWLGLTLGCAQCHSHKYDPVTQEDYYRLYAFFNSAADANNIGPAVDVRQNELFGWTEEQQACLRETATLKEELAALRNQAARGQNYSRLPWQWQAANVTAIRASGSIILKLQPDGTLLAKSEPNANDAYSLTIKRPDTVAPEAGITAVRLRVLPHPSLPAQGPGTAGNGNFVLTDVALKSGNSDFRFVRAWADHSQTNYPVEHAIDDKADTGWAVNVDAEQATRGLSLNSPHEAVFVLEQPVRFTDDAVIFVMRHDVNKNYLTGHFSVEFSTANALADSLDESIRGRIDTVSARIAELELRLPGGGRTVRQMVQRDLDDAPATYLLSRGDFLSPDRSRGPLKAGVPGFLNSTGRAEFASRLDLARWMVSRENPLTARVAVNRIWARYFGRGLVETENDFGYQGTPPSHPKLLDWLAAEFMENGWSVRHIHRLILTSGTYRQASAHLPGSVAGMVDPDNRLLWRQSRFRVEGEIVRDMAVFASGRFVPQIGGPGVYLPQPDGIYDFTQNRKEWPTATGADRYRRTMYTMFYRSAPYPLLTTFDAPDFSTACTQRSRSNTPLQSLAVANDPMLVELAGGLARRTLTESRGALDQEGIQRMFRRCLTRMPTPDELAVLVDYLSREKARFSGNPDLAREFVTPETGDPPPELLAAWTSIARVVLNTDEFLMRN